VKKFDVEDLVLNMNLLIANAHLRLTLGMNAYERAVKSFSSVVVTAAWLVFYQKVLAK
jgi:hypothetical protein